MLLSIMMLAAQCANVPVPEATTEAMRYYESGNLLWIFGQAWSLIIPFLFLVTGFTGKLAAYSQRVGKRWYFSLAVYLIIFVALYQLLYLPLDYYVGYLREHDYGLSTQTLSRWIGNYGKSTAIGIIGVLAFVWIFYLLLKKSPRRWWFYSSLVSIAIMFFLSFIQPIWIDPLFNQFGPMQDKKLESQILALANRAGIENSKVYEVDMSQDTKALNAYVVGFGNTKRIVLWDTTLQRMTPDEILFVMGHEMGHYVLNHIWWFMLYFSILSFVIFYLTFISAEALLKKHHKRFGFKALSSIASLPLLLLLISIYSLLATPLSNWVSRCMEHEADRFGLEITQNNEAAGTSFLKLQQDNLANPRPGPIFTFWRASHPSIAERIEFFNSYCPWKQGEPLKYQTHFNNSP